MFLALELQIVQFIYMLMTLSSIQSPPSADLAIKNLQSSFHIIEQALTEIDSNY